MLATTKKTSADVIFNTTVVTTEYLVDLLGINVTRLSLRDAIFGCPSYPVVPLDFLCKLLDRWGVRSLVLKADLDILRQINLPALAYLPDPSNGLGVFTVITGITDEVVYYFMAGSGIHKEKVEDFDKRWNGGVLVPLEIADDGAGDPDYAASKVNEDALKRKYKDSIQIIDDFLSDEYCTRIIEYCNEKNIFNRSKVDLVSGEQDVVHPVRTSYSAMIERNAIAVDGLYDRIAKMLNTPLHLIENIQCVRYGPEEQFGVHFDSDISNKRIYTLLIYLNDDYDGGETHFPEITLKVKPKKGRCVVFRNVDDAHQNTIYSVHAGLPIERGTKYACNIWVRYA